MKLGNTTQSGRDFVLSRQALRTLTAKIKRDGIPVLLKTLYQVSAAESPLDAIAGHREVVALFERPSLAALRARGFANKYLSGYMAKSLGKVARRKILLHHYRRLDQKLGDDFYSGNSRFCGENLRLTAHSPSRLLSTLFVITRETSRSCFPVMENASSKFHSRSLLAR